MNNRNENFKSDELIEKARKFPTATLHEAARKQGALPSAIKPVSSKHKCYGRAFTVLSPPCDNLWIHRAIYAASPGDILVIHVDGYYEAGYLGEIMIHAANARNLGGIVIDGCVRDGEQLIGWDFPVFSRGLCIQGTGKDKEAFGALNQPIRIGSVQINPGDLVCGDIDGVVVLAMKDMHEVLENAGKREEQEKDILERLSQGETTLDIYNLN